MPTTKGSSATLTLKVPPTTTTAFTPTTNVSNTFSSSQTFPTPSGNNSTKDVPFLGEPTLEGAYKYITIILFSSVAFLICFTIFAIITCRTIKSNIKIRPATKPSPIRREQRNNSFRSLDNDQISIDSIIPLSNLTRTRTKHQLVRPPSEHQIRCISQEDHRSATDYNREQNYIHNMYHQTNHQQRQSPSRRSSYDDSNASIQETVEVHKQVTPLTLNRPHKANSSKNKIKAVQLLEDDTHTYSIKPPSNIASVPYRKDSDWETLYRQ